uniref:Uncharacterized protein n=1 Tax=Panagrolaimus sp. PS1159 TaxID=55785 RepID=A0AC35FNJ3_9BILA
MADSVRIIQLFDSLIKGYQAYQELYASEITDLNKCLTALTTPQTSSSLTPHPKECSTEESTTSSGNESEDEEIPLTPLSPSTISAEKGRLNNEIALAEENKRLYEAQGSRIEKLFQQYQDHRSQFGIGM